MLKALLVFILLLVVIGLMLYNTKGIVKFLTRRWKEVIILIVSAILTTGIFILFN